MFIRRTLTRTLANGAQYFSHRLVRSERVDGRVRQVTLLNLGSDFTLGAAQWQALCARIEGLLGGDGGVPDAAEAPAVESEAQRVAALLLARRAKALSRDSEARESVDLGTLNVTGLRSVGVEYVALWAIRGLEFAELLRNLGMPRRQIGAVLGLIVARMVDPSIVQGGLLRWSEGSALGELLGVDFQSFDPRLAERAADSLLRCRRAIESQFALRLADLMPSGDQDLVYYLTGHVRGGMRAPARGYEMRRVVLPSPDWAPPTLGLVCDQHGFVRRSAGLTAAPTLGVQTKRMLGILGAPAGALVLLDESLDNSSEANGLRALGYRVRVRAAASGAEDASLGVDAALEDLDCVSAPLGLLPPDSTMATPASADEGPGLFLAVLAYQCVRFIRYRLATQGIASSWGELRRVLAQQARVTASVVAGDGRTLHVRQPTCASSEQAAIYQALCLDPVPGGVQKTVV